MTGPQAPPGKEQRPGTATEALSENTHTSTPSVSPATAELWVLTRVGAGRRQYSDLYLTKHAADRAARLAARAGRTVFVSRLRCGVTR